MPNVNVYVHHHGYLAHPPNSTIQYVGGKMDYLIDIDSDKMSFSDLDHYVVGFEYESGNYLTYF